MYEKTVSKKQCCSVVITTVLRLQRAYHNKHFVHFCFSYENRICLRWFFLFFTISDSNKRQVIKGKNVLSTMIKSRKCYWVSNKNNNVTCVVNLLLFYLVFLCLLFIQVSCLLWNHATSMLQKT